MKEDLAVIIRADVSAMKSDLNQAVGTFKQFAADVGRYSPKADFADGAAASFKRAGRAASEAKSGFMGAAAGVASFAAKAAIGTGVFLAAEAGIKGMGSAFDLLKDSVQKAADFEQLSIAFESILGSAEQAGSTLAELKKFAAETPFSSKDITDGAKQLLAMNVAADQLIPTLKRLGTVSALYGTPIKDEVYRYGTAKVQGVLHQEDVNQYTNRGIDVITGAAKSMGIDKSQVKKWTAENRFEFKHLEDALDDIVATKGLDILERQSKSLKGNFEQLSDAWDTVKLKLGQVVVKESGLKDVLKNGETFAKSVERAMDSEGFRRGVRFVSDAAKAGGQLAYEFGRAAVNIASISFEGIGRAFPQIERFTNSIHGLFQDAQNFKIDDEKIGNFALNASEMFVIGMAKMADSAEAFGDKMDKRVIKPLESAMRKIDFLNHVAENPFAALNAPVAWAMEKAGLLEENPKAVVPQKPVLPPNLTNEELVGKYSKLTNLVGEYRFQLTRPVGDKEFQKSQLEKLTKERDEFLKQFGPDREASIKSFERGVAPAPIKAIERPGIAPPPPPGPKSFEQIARENFGLFRKEFDDRKAARKAERDANAIAEMKQQMANAQVGGLSAIGPYSALMPAMELARGGLVKREDTTSPRLIELGVKLNDQFNPAAKLKEQLADLEKLRELGPNNGGIGEDVFGKARDSLVRDTADRMGIGGEVKLANAALVGSSEDARLIQQFRAGQNGGGRTVEDLLQRLISVQERADRAIQEISRKPGPSVLNIGPGGSVSYGGDF